MPVAHVAIERLNSATQPSFEDLCRLLSHGLVRRTTVGEIRESGGEVVAIENGRPFSAVIVGMRRSDGNILASLVVPRNMKVREMNVESGPEGELPRVFADFNNADRLGRVRLNTVGAKDDMERNGIVLSNGMQITLYDDDEFVTEGIVKFDDNEGWVAEIDWSAL
jgi:hypothetical protein